MAYLYSRVDNRPVRDSQPYAQDKLHYVDYYMAMFAKAMASKWKPLPYFDLMAGPGRCVIQATGVEFDGSPLLSLNKPFSSRIFVESDPILATALRERTAGHACEIIDGNCNDPVVIDRLRGAVGRGLALTFVDNLGLTVPLATLERLTSGRRVDLLIVMQRQHLTRNIDALLSGKQDRKQVDDYFGTAEWEGVARDFMKRVSPRSAKTTSVLVDFYIQQLAKIGYPHHGETEPMKNSRNAEQYRLMLFSKHPLGLSFFKKSTKRTRGGQTQFEF